MYASKCMLLKRKVIRLAKFQETNQDVLESISEPLSQLFNQAVQEFAPFCNKWQNEIVMLNKQPGQVFLFHYIKKQILELKNSNFEVGLY